MHHCFTALDIQNVALQEQEQEQEHEHEHEHEQGVAGPESRRYSSRIQAKLPVYYAEDPDGDKDQ